MRSLLGKWLQTAKDDSTELRRVFEAAQDQNVAEPIAWITQGIAPRAKAAAPFDPTDDFGWRKRGEYFRQTREWKPSWGGKFPGDHPSHPPWLPDFAAAAAQNSA